MFLFNRQGGREKDGFYGIIKKQKRKGEI